MEDYLMSIMKRASIFMILSQALIHFRPNPSYEKYLKFLAGIMTTVILIIPVLEWSRSGITEQYNICLEQYRERLQEISSAVSSQELLTDMTPSQSYLYKIGEEMKEKLNSYFIPEGYIIEKVEVAVLEEEGTEQENGAYSIQIQMIPDSMEVSAVKINKVSISENGEDTGDTASVREEGLKEKAAEVLEIDAERIEVMLNVPDMEESNEREARDNE